MIDGIIKANGTSRLMRANLPATYEAFKAQAESGTLPLDILFNAAGWSQQPTFLNKGNLLKDSTAALYGMDSTAVPDDVLSAIPSVIEPVGTIKTTVRTDLGDKWLLCDGASIDPEEYPELSALLPVADPDGTWVVEADNDISANYTYSYFGEANGKFFRFWCDYSVSPYMNYIYVADGPNGPWTLVEKQNIANESFAVSNLRYVNGYYVFVGYVNYKCSAILWTDNPYGTWNMNYVTVSGDTGTSFRTVDITFGNGNFVVYGRNSDGSSLWVWYSTSLDGTWEKKQIISGSGGYFASEIIFADGYFVACFSKTSSGYNPIFYYATDPAGTWTSRTLYILSSVTSRDVVRMRYENGMWFATIECYNGVAASSQAIAYTSTLTGSWDAYWLDPDVIGEYQVKSLLFDGNYYLMFVTYNYGIYVGYCTDLAAGADAWKWKAICTGTNALRFAGSGASNGTVAFWFGANIYAISQNQLPVLTDSRVYHYIKAKD